MLAQDINKNVRRICKDFPETEEIIDGFGHTAYKVKGKSFIRVGGTGGEPSLWFKSDK